MFDLDPNRSEPPRVCGHCGSPECPMGELLEHFWALQNARKLFVQLATVMPLERYMRQQAHIDLLDGLRTHKRQIRRCTAVIAINNTSVRILPGSYYGTYYAKLWKWWQQNFRYREIFPKAHHRERWRVWRWWAALKF